MRHASALFATIALTLAPSAALSQTAGKDAKTPDASTKPLRAVPPVPCGFTLGKTTLAEAEARWAALGAKEARRGQVAIGPGSGLDETAKLSSDRLLLVDVEQVDFEGKRAARFIFFDGVLFTAQTELQNLLKPAYDTFPRLSDKEVQTLEAQLRNKYGPPSETHQHHTTGKPNILIWRSGDNVLVLTRMVLGTGSALSYSNSPLLKKANQHKQDVCRKVPACWAKRK